MSKAGPPTGMVGNTISYTSAFHKMECPHARSPLLIRSQTLIEERVHVVVFTL